MGSLKNYVFAGLMAFNSLSTLIQAASLEGKVIDLATGNPLDRASVHVKCNCKTLEEFFNSSSEDGKFKLEVPDSCNNIDLSFSHVGYRTENFYNVDLDTLGSLEVNLVPELTELEGVTIIPKSFSGLDERLNPKKQVVIDGDLNEVLKKEFSIEINDIPRTLKKKMISVTQQSDYNFNLTIGGNVAKTFLDDVSLVNPGKFGILGSTSPFTLESVVVDENYNVFGGSPGSIRIESKSRPSEDGKSTTIYANPVTREFYTEKEIGDSAFAFFSGFVADNFFLKHLSSDVKVPTFVGIEAKINYWQNSVKEASLYFMGSRGFVSKGTIKSGVEFLSRDNSLFFNLDSDFDSFFPARHTKLGTKVGYQDSWTSINQDNLNLGLSRKRFNVSFSPRFFTEFYTLNTGIGFQRDHVKLTGDLDSREVGDGGGAFVQSIKDLQIGSRENDLFLYLGIEKAIFKTNFDANLKYSFTSRGNLVSLWGNVKNNSLFPFKLGFGLIPTYPSNMDVLDNRFIIPQGEEIRKERIAYVTAKAVKHFREGFLEGLVLQGNFYYNNALSTAVRKPDLRDVALAQSGNNVDDYNINFDERNIEGIDIPNPTFHLLKNERYGGSLRVMYPLGDIDVTLDVKYEDAFTFIPPYSHFKTKNDTAYFVEYNGKKVPHFNSNGLSFNLGFDADFFKNLNFGINFKYSDGKHFNPVELYPLAYDGGDSVLDLNGEVLYLKQERRTQNNRYPGKFDVDFSFSYRPFRDLRLFLFADNVLDNQRILGRVYREKGYGFLTDGSSWLNKDGYRFFGAGFQLDL